MMNVQTVLRQLKTEKAAIQNQINQLDSALSVLGGLNGFGRVSRGWQASIIGGSSQPHCCCTEGTLG